MSATGERLSPLDMLARLVSFDTESDKSNLALIDAVSASLDGWDVPYLRLPNAAGDKAAILATVGPMVGASVTVRPTTAMIGARCRRGKIV